MPSRKLMAFGLAACGLTAMTILFLVGHLPIHIPVAYWVLSVVSLIAYYLDKSATHQRKLTASALDLGRMAWSAGCATGVSTQDEEAAVPGGVLGDICDESLICGLGVGNLKVGTTQTVFDPSI